MNEIDLVSKEEQKAWKAFFEEKFNAYFVTLTASPSQSEHPDIFKKLVDIFVRRLNSVLYQRQYRSGRKKLAVCYVIERHKRGTVHAHLAIGALDGSEHLKSKSFAEVVAHTWSNYINHKKGYGISDVKNTYDASELFYYINKTNIRFNRYFIKIPA